MSRLPLALEGPWDQLKILAAPFIHCRVGVFVLQGKVGKEEQAGRLMVLGSLDRAGYFIRHFFSRPPAVTCMERVPVWRLRKTLTEQSARCDMVLSCLPVLVSSALGPGFGLRVPEWVLMVLRPDGQGRFAIPTSSNVRNDLRKVRKYGVRCLSSREEGDFHDFFDSMYLPLVRKRHVDFPQEITRAAGLRRFRQGEVVFNEIEGRRVAGHLVFRRRSVLFLALLGTEGGSTKPLQQGATAAKFVYALEQASRCKDKAVNFGGVRPSLHDGGLRYKMKWGCAVSEVSRRQYELRVHWLRLNPAVRSFLRNLAPIYRDRDGLAAVAELGENKAQQRELLSRLPGLSRINILVDSSQSSMESSREYPGNLRPIVADEGLSSAALFASS